jgi:signal transduction histidine kinase
VRRLPFPSPERLRGWARSRSLLSRSVVGSIVLAVLVASAFALMLVAVAGLRHSTGVQARSREVTSATLALEQDVNQLESSLRSYVLSGNDRFLASWRVARRRLPGSIANVETMLGPQAGQRRQASQLASMIHAYIGEYGVPLIGIYNIQPSAARAPVATRAGVTRINGIRTSFSSLLAGEAALASADTASAERETSRAEEIGIGALGVAAGLLALFGLLVVRGITRPVRTVATGASRVAAGDLSIRLPEQGATEILALTTAFNAMARSLEQGKRALEEQNEELRQSERLKSQLVSIVSHELRNPLTSILGYTTLLLRREFTQAESRHYLEIIQQQGNRLTSLIDHFLDSESIESGKVELELVPFDLKPLVLQEAKLVADKASEHRIEVAIEADALPVRGDRERLAQVFSNLLGNAVKYSPEGGRVEVTGEVVGGSVRVAVRDDGIGVADEHKAQIFTKFFRGDARESGIAGTGLGLSVSREIVEAHGGRIDFESRAGVGSRFWFDLPLDASAARSSRLADALSIG